MSAAAGDGGGCFDPPDLDRVMAEGFTGDLERARFLAHFGLGCKACEEHFLEWSLEPEPLAIHLHAEGGTSGPFYDPARRALLRRRCDLRGGFDLEPRAPGERLPFLRLLLSEARNASLGLVKSEAVACVRRAHDDLALLRRYLKQEGSPPGCPSPDRLHFLLLAAVGLASDAVACELRSHGEPEAAEELRRGAETIGFVSEAGQWLDRYLSGPRAG